MSPCHTIPEPHPLEREFVEEAIKAGGLRPIIDSMGDGNPTGLYDAMHMVISQGVALSTAFASLDQTRCHRCVYFHCGDCNHILDKVLHFGDHISPNPHMHTENGGAILLDPDVVAEPGFNTADFYLRRLTGSLALKGMAELYIEGHSVCGQGRNVHMYRGERRPMYAPHIVRSTCIGKGRLKDVSAARKAGHLSGRPFKVGALYHFHASGLSNTYYVHRPDALPVVERFERRFEDELAPVG